MIDQYIQQYFKQVEAIVDQIDKQKMPALVEALVELRKGGNRLFLIGVGGSAGNASHAVNDFRKLCALEAYAPTDNVSELSARINDEGWDSALAAWLKVSRLSSKDALLILSVGGGSLEKNASVNLIQAVDLAQERKAKVFGIVGRDGGHLKQVGDVVVAVPPVNAPKVSIIPGLFRLWSGTAMSRTPDYKWNPKMVAQSFPVRPHPAAKPALNLLYSSALKFSTWIKSCQMLTHSK